MTFGEGTDFASVLGDALASLMPTLRGATVDPRDELIVRHTRGTGRFSADKKFITLDMKMFTLSGEEDGSHHGVWQALFSTPQELLQVPAMPAGPMDVPVGPVPHLNPIAQTKAIWSFGDGSSLTVVGPAMSHLIPLKDGSFIFLVSTAQVVTCGTGRYEGAVGVNQSLGTTHVPAGVDFFGAQSATFEAATLDTFKVIRRRYHRPFSIDGTAAAVSASSDGASIPQPSTASTSNPPASGEPQAGAPTEVISATYPFAAKQIEIRNSTMSYIDEGSGDTVLFLHGNPTWSYLWRNIIPHLSPLGRCIAPDLIGMGRSGKPDIKYGFLEQYAYLEELINKLKLGRITLVIHDWGSALGFHYANMNRDKIKGIAFMEAMVKSYASWNEFPGVNAPQQLRDAFRAYRSEKGTELIVKQNLFMAQTEALAGRPLSKEEIANYEAPFLAEQSRQVILRWANDLPIEGIPPDVTSAVNAYSEYLRSSDVPKLLLYTNPGAILFQEHVEWCKQNMPRLEAINLDPSNTQVPIHLLQERYPRQIGEIIASWHQKLSS